MPPTATDDEEVQAPPVTSEDGANPLIPSAPLDAEPGPAPIVYAKPPPLPPATTRPAVPPAPPLLKRRKSALEKVKDYEAATERYAAGEADKAAKHQTALDRFDATQMYEAQKEERGHINAETQQTLQRAHVQTEKDPNTGEVQPQRDQEGNIVYKTGKGPIKYDEAGRAIQTQYDESGPKVVPLDKNADIGTMADRPNELYKKNKHAAWDYVGTVAEGLASKDPAIQTSAKDAQLSLDKQLHGAVNHDLSTEVAARTMAVQGKAQDYNGKAVTLKTLNEQLANFDKNNPGVNETEGHWFTGGAKPTQTAQVLQEKRAGIEKQIADLQAQGYSSVVKPETVRAFLKPELDALHEAREWSKEWVAPKEAGELDQMITDRKAALMENGSDAVGDPILSSLEKHKPKLGLNQPAAADDEAALKSDPLFGPVLAERDKLKADRTTADTALASAETEYGKRLQPFRDQLDQADAQINPLQDRADKLQARLETIAGMPPMVQGEDPDVHRQQLMLHVSQIKDRATKVRAQTVLNSLEPLFGEITARRAQMQPVADAHSQLESEARAHLDQQRQVNDAHFSERENAYQEKMANANTQRQSDIANAATQNAAVAKTKTAMADAKAGNKNYGIGEKNTVEFKPGSFYAGLHAAETDGLIDSKFAAEHRADFKKVDDAYNALQEAAGDAQAVKAILHGVGMGGAFLAGAAPGAKLGSMVPGGPIPKGIGAALGGLATGTMAAFAARKGLEKLADYSDAVKSLTASAELHPVLDSAGELIAFGASAPRAITKLARLASVAGEAVSDLGPTAVRTAQIKTVGRVLGVAGLTGAAFETTIRPAFDAARYTVADTLGIPHDELQAPSVKSIATMVALATLTAGHSLKFKEYSAGDVASIMFRAKIRQDAGIDFHADNPGQVLSAAEARGMQLDSQKAEALSKPLTKQEVSVWNALKAKTERMEKSGAFDDAGVKFTGATQAQLPSLRGEGEPLVSAGVEPVPHGSGEGPRGEGGPRTITPGSRAPSLTNAYSEIDSLAPSEHVAPEQVEITQHALRGMVKLAQGQPMESLTSVEQKALQSETPDGIARVEMVNGKPVINDATLARVRTIAPATAQLLPRSEEQQRQTAINEPKTKPEKPVAAVGGQPQNIPAELPTFSVEVQSPGGETTTTEVQAPSEQAARSQVAARITPGEGLVRDVTQVTLPAPAEHSAYVPPERFESHVIEQITKEAGRALDPNEEVAVKNLIKVAAPAYERWSKAFETVNASLAEKGSAGVAFQPTSKALALSIPDLSRHAALYQDPKLGNALVLHEVAHAVTTNSGAKVVQLFKSAPESLKAAMKEAYRSPGATDYNYAHELWAYALAGHVEIAAGRKIKLSGKFLPEQANRDFIVKYKRAFAEVLRFTRDIEGYLRKRGVAEKDISQWKELEQLFVSKIREVDASPEKPAEKESKNELPATTTRGAGARAPPTNADQPARSEAPVESADSAGQAAPDSGKPATPPESPARADEPSPGAELTPEIKSQLATRLNLPEKAVGHVSKVTSNGRTVNVAYVAQEAVEARPSHDAEGRSTPGYDQSLQPRDRSLPAYRKQAQNISRSLDFAQAAFFPETKIPATTPDHGAPIMTQAGDTLIGNGREIGIRQAYQQGSGAKYKIDFIRNARAFGIDPATVRDMKEPILKRVILDDLPQGDLVRFSQESNEAAAMGTNAIEMAGRDATRLTPELLSLFDANYAIDSAKNQQFLSTYLRDVVKGGEANEANLTGSELERRVRAAVFAYAYGTDATGRAALDRLSNDEADSGGKKITNALLTVAPIVARMKTDIATGDLFPLDISAAVSRAAQDISETLKNKPVKQSTATALSDMRNQASLVESDPLLKAVTDFLLDNRGSRQAIEQGLSNYVEAVFKVGNPKNADLFERTVPEPLELFNRATSPEALRGDLNAQSIAEPKNLSPAPTSLVTLGDLDQLRANNEKRLEPPKISEIALSRTDLTNVPQNERAQHLVARGDLATNSHQALAKTSDEALFALGDDTGLTTGPQHAAFITESGDILTRAEMKQAGLGTHSQQLKAQPTLPEEQNEKTENAATESQASLPAETSLPAEIGSGQPAAASEVATLRKGENQGDLLSKQTEEFRLVGETGTDFSAIQAAREKAKRERAESAKAQLDLFSQSIDRLPERMTGALRGLLSGDSLDEIASANGVAKEGVPRLAMEAIRRMRTDIGESEQLEILDSSINQELKAQETNDPLKQLMALIDTDILGSLYKKAEGETPGQFETGRPDLTLGAEGASIRAAHQFHTDSFSPETIEGWDEQAERNLANPEWARKFSQDIVNRYLNGDRLLAWETRAAMRLIAADSHSLGTPEQKLGHAVRAFAYARMRSQVGQELASGRDPFKTPEERGREFLSKTFFRLKPEVEAKIEAEPDPAKRADQLSTAMKERIAELEKAFSYLAGKGITVDDIFNGSWELHGKGKKLIESEMAGYDVRQQQALKLAQTGTRSAAEISKATGLSVADVERINDEFIDQLEKSLTAKVAGGLSLENIDLQGALFAQPPETPAPANAAGKTPEEIKAEVRRIIRGMGFVASKDLGRFKVQKRKKPKLFVPPAPYKGPVPSAEPVPFEKREQGGLEIKAEAPVRLPNENAPVPYPPGQTPPYPGRVLGQTGLPLESETPLPPATGGEMDPRTKNIFYPETRPPNESAEVPYPEGQSAPYTGRVLGQTGLPLYQEMMIRKGVDMGNMDDLIKIGRAVQSLDARPFDMVYEAWVNNIFSGVGTHTANISGNTLSMAMDFTLQRGMEALLNTVYRDADSPTFAEFKHIAKGILPGITAGIKRGARAWNTESSVFSWDVLNDQAEILEALDKSGGVPPAIPGTTGKVVRIPVRALLLEDEIFKSVIGQMEVGAQAYRIAKSEGLVGDKMQARMNELISTPGSQAWARAVEKAIYLTYQEPTGLTTLFRDQGKSAALGKMAATAAAEGRHRTAQVLKTEEMVVRNLYRAAGFFFPVIRTTYNIFKIGVGTVNVLPSVTSIPYRAARAGFYQWRDGKPFVESYSKARQIHDIAKQIIAWTTFATLWSMTTGGENDEDKPILLTGSMPYNQTKRGLRDLNDRAYGGTYMLRIGGRNGVYIPYGRVEPIATVLGTVVDAITNVKKMSHGQSLAETGDAFMGYFLAQAQSKTFLSGFSDLTKSLEGSTSFTDIPKKLILQAFVPNLIRQPLRALDEWVRENKTAPALYQTLPVGAMAEKKIDTYGRPIAKGGNAFSRIFIAAGIKPDAQLEKADRLLLHWNREHPTESWAPAAPLATYHDATGKTKKMTGPEQTKFLETSGRRAADKLRAELTESQVTRPSPEDVKRVQQIFEEAHRQTKEEMFPKHRVNVVREAFKKAA